MMVAKKLKELKNKMKNVIKKVKISALNTLVKTKAKPKFPPQPKKTEIPLQVAVSGSKFYTGRQPSTLTQVAEEFPCGYGKDKIVLQVRDPWWVHAYWEITGEALERLRRQLGNDVYSVAKTSLRAYDISYINFNGSNAHRFFDIEVPAQTNSWYIDTQAPGRWWCVDFGLKLPDGQFLTIVRSNSVHTPIEGPSWITDEEWMVPEELFARLYGIGLGFGSSPLKPKHLWQERLKGEFASGVPFSVSSWGKKAQEKGFWLVVNTELILYGATEPDAKVTVQGKSVPLRPDGTFSLRFALPDGKQVIPVVAKSNDATDERTITPVVTRETK